MPRLTLTKRVLALHLLQTAIKVVKRQDAAKAAAAAASPAPAAAAPAEEAGATPTRRLEFGQARRACQLVFCRHLLLLLSGASRHMGRDAGCSACGYLHMPQGEASSEAASVAAYVAHIEQGLGEVVRRLEKKVDSVAQLLDKVSAAGWGSGSGAEVLPRWAVWREQG